MPHRFGCRWIVVTGIIAGSALADLGLSAGIFAQEASSKPPVQDWNRDWFADRSQQDAFMGALKQSAAQNPEMHGSVMLINDLVTGQTLGATGQSFGVMSAELGLLANEEFRAELDISDSQFAEMQTKQNDWLDQLRADLKAADRTDVAALLQGIQEAQRDAQQSLKSILLPPQRRRLEQALWEQQLRRRSLATLLGAAPLKETLGVTDRQAEQLLELETKLDQEIADELERLQLAARQKILSQLTPTQQSDAERLLGPALRARSQKPKPPQQKLPSARQTP